MGDVGCYTLSPAQVRRMNNSMKKMSMSKSTGALGSSRVRTNSTGVSNRSSMLSSAGASAVGTPPRPARSSSRRSVDSPARPSPSPARVRASPKTSPSKARPEVSFAGPPTPPYDPKDKVDFRRSLNLRGFRKDLLNIRKKLQDHVFVKWPNVRVLMAAFDHDGDGLINENDWMYGLKQYNFPLTEKEGHLMFQAIDENGDETLSYKEMTDILEPASLTTWAEPGAAENMDKMMGFVQFSKKQCKQFSGGKPMTPGGSRLTEEVYDKSLPTSPPPMDPILRRCPESVTEELQIIKDKIEKAIAKSGGEESTLSRFAKCFREADVANKHFLTHKEFIGMLSGERFGIPLTRRQRRILVHEIADDNGAVDLKDFANFLSSTYVPVSDAMVRMTLAGRDAMKKQAELDAKLTEEFITKPPPSPSDPWLAATSKPAVSPVRMSARENPFSGGGGGRGFGSARSSTLEAVTARSAPDDMMVTAAGTRAIHPLLTTCIDKGHTRETKPVDPSVGFGSAPARRGSEYDATLGDRSESGLTRAAERLLQETRKLGPKAPIVSSEWAAKDDVKATIRAPPGSMAYMPPSEQFKTRNDADWGKCEAFDSRSTKLRVARADRRLAAEARVLASYDRQTKVKDDMDRRRIAAKRNQQLNYIARTSDI